MSEETCFVCGEPIPDEYSKFDPKAPVYTDDGVYHLDCEDEVFEEVFTTALTGDEIRIYNDPSTPSGKNWEYTEEDDG